jgi:TolA-binding protein
VLALASPAVFAAAAALAAPSATWNELATRRAAALLTEGDPAGAAEALAARDSSDAEPRADFLEAWAARARGDRERFRQLVAKLATEGGDPARWARALERLDDARVPPGLVPLDSQPAESLAALFRLDRERSASEARPARAEEARARHAAVSAGLAALRDGRLDDARRLLADAEASWRAEDAELAALQTPSDSMIAALFREWDRGGAGERALLLETEPLDLSLAARAEEALDLHRRPEGPLDPPRLVAAVPTGPAARLRAPTAADRRGADELAAEAAALRAQAAEERRRLALADAGIRRAEDYYTRGLYRADAEARSLAATIARLEELLARSAEIVAQLAALRDEETRRIARRTSSFLESCRKQLVISRALVRFRVEGAAARRRETLPPDVPSPAQLLAEEQSLCAALESWLSTFAARAPELLARSHDEIWKPRVTDGLRGLAEAAAREAARAGALAAAIDSSRGSATDPTGRRTLAASLAATRARAAAVEDSLRSERRRVVAAAVHAARDGHRRAAEGLFYGAAAAAHELALRRDAAPGDDPAALLEDAEARYRAFLDGYPGSPACSEVRFRLADVLLNGAREDFRVAMERFLGASGAATESDARALAPFVDYAPALSIYLSLLADDPAFAHRDAVLYHAGMILADQGDPAGLVHLAALVAEHPSSAHAQEAHLRLGDDRFARKDFRGSLAHYEAAAAGADAEHAAIALYQAGWARFNLDDHEGAAASFRRLSDHYDSRPEAARTTDLRDEAEDHLVQTLARAGGAPAFGRLYPEGPEARGESRVLARLGDLFREYSRFEEAVAADSVWLARWPERPGALERAGSLVASLERAERPDAAREARLTLAPRFRERSSWWRANADDSLRQAGDEFARVAYVGAALHHHHAARENGQPAAWEAASSHYATLLDGWPASGAAPAWRYGAGEAALSLGRFADAVDHFERAAASDTASFRADAHWQAVAARDAWYEDGRDGPKDETGPAELARPLLGAIDGFVVAHPADERVADLLWRRAHVARAQGWSTEAIASFGALAETRPADPRALDASRFAAQLLVDVEDFRRAGDAYAQAARLAHAAGKDSLAAELEAAVPACAYREAEASVARDGDGEGSARLFEDVAARWPRFEHAPQALYRAGAGWTAAQEPAEAVRAWTLLTERYPEDDLARDAMLEIARTWQAAGRRREAARASERFADAFPDDPDAAPSLLNAAELAAAAGDSADAERLEDRYMERRPEDSETALALLERRVRRELLDVGPRRPISALLGVPAPRPPTATRRWLDLAAAHPAGAAPDVLAQVSFLKAEEARARYDAARLTLPLGPSVAQKKSLLENALQEYRSCAARETAPWNRAAAARIGECLIAFGDALRTSERPADLEGDDLLAYEEEIERQSWEFEGRGEEVWTQLVRNAGDAPGDPWVERTRHELWPRIARRFTHRPEVDYPLVPEPERSGDVQP